jgi:sugar fermentation stimulation protein A
LGGRESLAFLQNTGRLLEYMVRGRRGFCIPVERPKKLSRRLFAILENDLAAIVDTYLQSRAFEEAVDRDLIPWLRGCRVSRKNIPLAETRIDYLMSRELGDVLVELKSAVLRLGHHASYPDCPSSRGVRQVRGMLELVKRGGRAILVFIAALPHVSGFKLNHGRIQHYAGLSRGLIGPGSRLEFFRWHMSLRAPRQSSLARISRSRFKLLNLLPQR